MRKSRFLWKPLKIYIEKRLIKLKGKNSIKNKFAIQKILYELYFLLFFYRKEKAPNLSQKNCT